MTQASGAVQAYPQHEGLLHRILRSERRRLDAFASFFRDALEESRTLRKLASEGYAGRETGSRF